MDSASPALELEDRGNRRIPTRRRLSSYVLGLTSAAFLLAGVFGLGQLATPANPGELISGGQLPAPSREVTIAARIGMADALLGILTAIGAFVFLSSRNRAAWTAALIASGGVAATSGFLAIQGASLLATHPARGDFAGLANLGTLALHVVTPGVVAMLALIALGCLVALRTSRR